MDVTCEWAGTHYLKEWRRAVLQGGWGTSVQSRSYTPVAEARSEEETGYQGVTEEHSSRVTFCGRGSSSGWLPRGGDHGSQQEKNLHEDLNLS